MGQKVHSRLLGLVLFGVVSLVSTVSAEVRYTVTDLGTLGGNSTFVNNLNNLGQVVGYSTTADGRDHAFLYADGVMQDLRVTDEPYSSISAMDINNAGQVIGVVAWSDAIRQGFIWQRGTTTFLEGEGLLNNVPLSINNAGKISGWRVDNCGNSSIFLWNNGIVTELNNSNYQDARPFWGNNMNNLDQVVGWASCYDDQGNYLEQRVILWDGTDVSELNIPFTSWGVVGAINDRGQITGSTDIFGLEDHDYAFLWENGVMKNLGGLAGYEQSYGRDINNLSQIVGYSENTSGEQACAFIYENGELWNLNDLIDPTAGVFVERALAINDAGQILVQNMSYGYGHAYLLTPVPEPGMLLLLTFGFVFFKKIM